MVPSEQEIDMFVGRLSADLIISIEEFISHYCNYEHYLRRVVDLEITNVEYYRFTSQISIFFLNNQILIPAGKSFIIRNIHHPDFDPLQLVCILDED